jgi:hypothetical protein
MSLEVDVISPLHTRIVTEGKKKSADRCLTFTSLVDGLKDSKLLGEVSNDYIIPGPIAYSNPKAMKKSLNRASDILSQYFGLFEKKLSDHWRLGNAAGGYLCTNDGIRALLIILKEICNHIEREEQLKCSDLDVNDLMSEIDKYTNPIIKYFESAPSVEILGIRRQAGGKAGVKRQANIMMEKILEKNSSFGTQELKEFVAKMNSQETHDARDALADIESKVFKYVVTKLRKECGEQWWETKIPPQVQKVCYDRKIDDKHTKDVEQYICLIDIRNILMYEDNWDLFQKEFSLGEKNNSKKKSTDWLGKLNTIRNIVFHPPKGDISTDQVNYVNDIIPKVNLFFS